MQQAIYSAAFDYHIVYYRSSYTLVTSIYICVMRVHMRIASGNGY